MADTIDVVTDEAAEKAYAAAAQAVLTKAEAAVAEPVAAPVEAAVAVPAEAKPIPFPGKAKRATAPAKPAIKAAKQAKPAVKAVKKSPEAVAPKAAVSKSKPKTKSNPIQKSKESIMATKQTAQFAENIEAFAANAQNKTKALLAKASVALGEANALTKGNVDAVVASGKVLTTGLKTLGEGYVAEGKTAIKTVKADAKKLAAVKSPSDLLVLQNELLKRNVTDALTFGAKNSAALFKLAGEVFAPVAARSGEVAGKFAKAA